MPNNETPDDDGNTLRQAMKKAEQPVAADTEATARDLAKRTEDAMQAPAPVFNTHTNSLRGRLVAEERALLETAADIDAKIRELNAQRDDVMLACSGVTAAIQAMEQGR